MFGIGRMSYAHWLSTNDKRLQGESWLLGFWSGMNAADGAPSSDVGHGTDGLGILGEVTLICRAHPSERLGEATMEAYYLVRAREFIKVQ